MEGPDENPVDANVVSQAAALDQTGTGLTAVLLAGLVAAALRPVRGLLRRRPGRRR